MDVIVVFSPDKSILKIFQTGAQFWAWVDAEMGPDAFISEGYSYAYHKVETL